MEHTDWIALTAPGEAIDAIARKANLVPRTFARRVERGHIDAESVIAIALAYNKHPVRALVDTGYIPPEYALRVDPATAIRMVTEEQLADEVLRRMKEGMKTNALTTPIDELEARRLNTGGDGVRGADYDDDTVHEWDDSMEHAADSSLDEQQEREIRGEDPID